ncbi:MAG: helix-turn-helix domain-containing protein [Sphingobium sp.]
MGCEHWLDGSRGAAASACSGCAVRDRAICAVLTDAEREAFVRIGRRVTVPRGQRLIWEGDQSTVVANVVEGTMQLSISTADGREQIVGVAYPADFIGRPFGATSGHSVTALSDASVCLFPRTDFDRVAASHAGLEHSLLHRTLDDLDRARTWMLLLGRRSAREKVAAFLLDMARRFGRDAFDLPLNRQQIADILGTTIETVSRQLTALKREGLVDLPTRARVEIRDRQALEDRAEAA